MGVPKFFRYISERYPCLSELVKDYQIPEFDNLYLDMNGIIHMCSHPNDFDPHFRISEEKIFEDIFHYLEILFRMIQPRKLFFMAIDGVAPRAKMNQQRGRRFRSAKEAEVLEQRAKAKGEKLPSEARFDSNCITPGTPFMAKLHDQLQFFVTKKVSTDKQWKGVKVILSGHETPGEGEHKIMEYIRWMKSQPDYDANMRHCLYGLDADLIMLGLCTHEPHFSLLREEVKFGKQQKRASAPEETRFFLLHLSLMREYLDLEFQSLKNKLSFPYDLESIIDDWVFMGFLVGNDFIPHLPDVHISSGALPMLYKAYMEVLPTFDGYINEKGTLCVERFQKFMEKLAAFDINQFKETYADIKYFEGKTGRKFGQQEHHSNQNGKGSEKESTGNSELDALIKATDDLVLEKYFDDEDDDTGCVEDENEDDVDVFGPRIYDDDSDPELSGTWKMEFHQHKKDYYRNKLEYGKVTHQVLRDQAEGYVRAIQWNLHYYYHGVASWSWYYPHHYAPYISDICNFKDVDLHFDIGKPFQPFEQLLAVLPAASKTLLPAPYQELMVKESSPILEYYPADFRTDLNGKKQEWEAVVLIPFIDEGRLLNAMEPCYEQLTDEEKRRNKFGPMLEYTYTDNDLGEYEAPAFFGCVKSNHAQLKPIWREELQLKREDIVHGLLPGAKLDVYFPGFPTFKHLPYSGELRKAKVAVFEQASRGDNMILTLDAQHHIVSLTLKEAADQYLGKDVFCGWPHLSEGCVVGVSNGKERYNLIQPSQKIVTQDLPPNLVSQFEANRVAISDQYMRRMGVDIGDTHLILYSRYVEGRKYTFGRSGKITLEKMYSKETVPYAIQTVVKDIAVQDPSFVQYRTLSEIFPIGAKCFLLSRPHYGAMGEVVDGGANLQPGCVKVTMIVPEEPNVADVSRNQHLFELAYFPGGKAAQRIGISSHLLSRITGTVFLITGNKQAENPSKLNIGLNLKFNKKNEEVPGYTRKVNDMWLYSMKAIELVHQYVELFPEVFEHISRQSSNDVYDDKAIFTGEDCDKKVRALDKWLKEVPSAHVDRRACGSEVLDEGVVEEIQNVVDAFFQGHWKVKKVVMQVKPHTLYKSELRVGNLAPDPSTVHQLFDRVICVREDSAVPLGLKGSLIGIHKAEKEADILYDVLFDCKFPGGMSYGSSVSRMYRMSRTALINLSHGQRLEAGGGYPKVATTSDVRSSTSNVQGKQRATSAFASCKGQEYQESRNWRSEGGGRQRLLPEAARNGSQGFKFPAPPTVTSKPRAEPQPQTSQDNERALWHELQVKSNNFVPRGEFAPPPASSLPVPKENIASSSMKNKRQQQQQVHQVRPVKKELKEGDGTTILKKMLGIPGENGEQISLRSQSQTVSQSQPLDALFKIASLASPTVASNQGNARSAAEETNQACSQLLNYYQIKGVGVPVFSYACDNSGSVSAEVTLPDGRIVKGNPEPTKHKAAENVASQALRVLSLKGDMQTSLQPQQFFQQFRTGQFPPPPQVPVSIPSGNHPGWAQRGMTAFPRAPPPFPQLQNNFQHQNEMLAQKKHQQQSQKPNQKRDENDAYNWRNPQPSHQRHQQVSRQNAQQQGSVPEPKSFVPLQAMKQQRNATKSAALLRREHEEQKTKSALTDSKASTSAALTSDQAKVRDVASDRQTDGSECKTKAVGNEPKSDHHQPENVTVNQSQVNARSASRMRKNRLAINFNVPSN